MKKLLLLFSVTTLALPLTSSSQPPPDAPGGFDRPPMEEGFRPASPVQRWMKQLQETNPAEFERLRELRMSNPEAFRKEARVAVETQIMTRLAEERPAIHEILSNLSEDDRKWLMERLARQALGPGGPEGNHREGMEGRGREGHGNEPKREAMQRNRELVRQYHEARTEEEKNLIKQELRDQLSNLYDQRIAERSEQLKEAEQKLDSIRKALAQGQEGKEAFIEEKLEIWLNSPPPGPGRQENRPPPPGDEPL